MKTAECPRPRPQYSLLAPPVSFAARQRHLDHTGRESDPQGVAPAVYLHADDALVVDAVDAAPEGRSRGKRSQSRWASSWTTTRSRTVHFQTPKGKKKQGGLECGKSAGER